MSKIAPTQAIYIDPKSSCGAIAGLQWRVLSASNARKQGAEIREFAEHRDAKKHAILTLNSEDGSVKHVGLLLPEYDDDESLEHPKKGYSFALMLQRHFGLSDAIVAWKLERPSQEQNDEYALVVLNKGAPMIDKIMTFDEARARATDYITGVVGDGEYAFYSNVSDEFEGASPVATSEVFSEWDASTRIKKIPVDQVKVLALIVLAVAFMVGQQMYSDYTKRQERQRQIEAQRKADKKPIYLKALPSAIHAIGISSVNLQEQIENLFQYPILADGWRLKDVHCEVNDCISTWDQQGGYTKDLANFLKGHKQQANLGQTSGVAMQFPSILKLSGRDSFSGFVSNDKLTDMLQFQKEIWKKAKVKIILGTAFRTWPETYGDFGPGFGVQRLPVKITASREILIDFLRLYGKYIFWDDLKISVNISSKTDPIIYEAKGYFYVYQ